MGANGPAAAPVGSSRIVRRRRVNPFASDRCSRRRFIQYGGAAAAGWLLGRAPLGASEPAATIRAVGGGLSIAAPADVVEVRSEHLFSGHAIRAVKLEAMLAEGLTQLTGEADVGRAWRSLLGDDDIIGIKFNQSGAERIGTTPLMAEALVKSLARHGGFDPDRIVLLEEGENAVAGYRTRPAERRYSQRSVDFGCGRDQFVGFVDQVTAIINVPFLKTHHAAVMTGCLKNLSHGLVRHPARFHAGGCDPAIGRIVASLPIRSRLRLNVVNAIRVVVDGGPEAHEGDIERYSGLLLSADPVAADACGFDILNRLRTLRNQPGLLPAPQVPRQLQTAARLGLGEFDAERINHRVSVV